MSLAVRERRDEQMDDPSLDPEVYAAVIGDLARLNRLLMTARPTIAFLRRALRGRRRFRLLDVGFGQGDMLRSIERWAARKGVEAELVGVDLNPSSLPAAAAATPAGLPIEFRTGDYADTVGEGWDFVISSSVTHHMSDEEIHAFLRFMEAESRIGWMINDVHRLALAYYGFPVLARIMRWHRMVREDGRLSIARSFRKSDWRRLVEDSGIDPSAPKIVRRFPFRLCVERLR
ncbi:methyltransferase domain-containing protein [Allosphingosinicella sp.]|jgi:2-polyprenyl-3-methyl-5-hydroxy-6-metoxy-1,4-benzoquinol methylase|uniref:methyltransferase domain-containing protein n=1 Tax=Allosphingosinicella sp. TaxID=2823234 RepID=UPI002F0CBA40